jgi:hypothetical protein
MSILKLISQIDKATQTMDKATQAIDKVSTLFDSKTAPPKRILSIEEREKLVKSRIKEKGLQVIFRDIYPDL